MEMTNPCPGLIGSPPPSCTPDREHLRPTLTRQSGPLNAESGLTSAPATGTTPTNTGTTPLGTWNGRGGSGRTPKACSGLTTKASGREHDPRLRPHPDPQRALSYGPPR